jgi:hypothetical protein
MLLAVEIPDFWVGVVVGVVALFSLMSMLSWQQARNKERQINKDGQ